ncbi:Protein AATF [Pelomyxa schiedti]|nr:Protein AATF [Pelomyxa schiedti]
MSGWFLVTIAVLVVTTSFCSGANGRAATSAESLLFGDYWTCPWRLFPVDNVSATDPELVLMFEALAAEVEATRILYNHTAVAMQVVYQDKDLWFGGFGATQEGVAPGPDTIFRIGSVSKLFAVLAMLQQRDLGNIVSLDDPISKLVPSFSMPNPWATTRDGVTWRQAASQVAGLPRAPPCVPPTSTEECTEDTATILERLKTIPLILPPGSRPTYSNLAYGLIGRLLEPTFGQTYEDYVSKSILSPLGMSSTGFDYTSDVISRMARGYEVPINNMNWVSPSGQMYSTASDMSKFMKFLLNWYEPYSPSSGQVLDGTTIREWLHPGQWNPEGKSGYGMPWETYYYDDHLLITKSGDVQGYGCIVTIFPDLHLGIAVLMNAPGQLDQTVYQVTASDFFVPEFTSYISAKQQAPQLAVNPDNFAGVYQMEGSPSFVLVKETNGQLHAKFPGVSTSDFLMVYYGDLTFQAIEYAESPSAGCMLIEMTAGMGNWLYFETDASGVAVSFTIPGLYYGITFIKIK